MNSLMLYKLKMKFFPPESRVELFKQTLYHRFVSTKLFVKWQLAKARQSYIKWRAEQVKKAPPETDSFELKPKVTFLLAIGPNDLNIAVATIRSIQNLRISNWEILLVAGGNGPVSLSFPPNVLGDPRLKPVFLDKSNRTKWLRYISGEFIVHCVAGDKFFDTLLDCFYQSINSFPSADAYYYDCEFKQDDSSRILPFFKPAKFSPELLLSVNYLSRSLIRKTSIENLLEKADQLLDLLNQEYCFLLQLFEEKAVFEHIPQVLITQSFQPTPNNEHLGKVVNSHLSKYGFNEVIVEKKATERRIRWKIGDPSIAIVIPTKNHYAGIKTLLDSIFSLTDYPNYSINLVDNASSEKEVSLYYSKLGKNQKVKIIHYDKTFNYSEAINLGVKSSDSELVLLLNNDMKVIDSQWLRELAQWALLPEIGVVGAKLLYANQTIQHAGLVIGLQGFMGHLYLNAPDHYYGLLGSVDWYRNVSAVTGACQMIRRSVFEELGGYDEEYQLLLSDIEFCLRAIKNGYRNLYNPFVSLIHYEGQSRGNRVPIKDIARAYEQLEEWLRHDDPYFSPNLTYTTIPQCQLEPLDHNDRYQRVKATRDMVLKQLKT